MIFRISALLCMVTFTGATQSRTRCFDCSNVRHPADCKTIRECPAGQKCKVTEFVTSTGTLLYNSSCETTQKCAYDRRRAASDYKTLSKRSDSDILVCVHCCNDEFCNARGCGARELTQPGAGSLCFKCTMESDPHNCTSITQCGSGEVCMLTEMPPRMVGQPSLYNSGCVGQRVCHAYAMIGKKKRHTFCHRCCADNFCNDRCDSESTSTSTSSSTKITATTSTTNSPTTSTPALTTTTTTPKSTSTPQPTPSTTLLKSTSTTVTTKPTTVVHTNSPASKCHHYGYTHARINGTHICYKIHYEHHSWSHANSKCHYEGGTLAVVETEAKWFALKQNLLQAKQLHHWTHQKFYIGAKDAGSAGKDFYWTNGARVTFTHWGHDEPDGGHHQCLYLNTEEDFMWHDTSCDGHYHYICTIPLK